MHLHSIAERSATGDVGTRRYRVAVDVGGTFTDVVLTDAVGRRLVALKVDTTPANRADGVMNGLRAIAKAAGIGLGEIAEVVHGSTTGTNALIERTGANVGLLVTAGFRDLLEIGRVMRPHEGLYDFTVDRPPPLIPRRLCVEAVERVDATGAILTPLDEASVAAAATTFAAAKVDAIAICLLFSFLNPKHEVRAAQILADRLPRIPLSLSCEVSPEYREYERANTTVMNAYLAPVMSQYLARLEQRIRHEIGSARLAVIQANGGSTSAEHAKRLAVTTVNSGPAGGVVAAAFYGRRHRRPRVVSVDMGGTSFDIGLVEGGVPRVTTEGAFQGLPVKIPIIDLHIIGAGGGSIAWIDRGGALNVGPQSAGAEPGPTCYGRGGVEPTVTDANVVLGRLNPENFNAGQMTLDRAAARAAVAKIADKLDTTVEQAALGIVRVVNANMVKGVATVTIQRGIDVRDFSLLSFGGAAGAHAVDIARELGMAEVVIPPLPGTFSAIGLLITEMRHDYVTALGGMIAESADLTLLERRYQEMERAGRNELAAQGYPPERIRLTRMADLKVSGQTYELLLKLPGQGQSLDQVRLKALLAEFSKQYRARYAFFYEGEPIELVNLRLSAEGLNAPVALPRTARASPNAAAARTSRRPVYFEGRGSVLSAIYRREALRYGMRVAGPAVIEEATSATLIPTGFAAEVVGDLGLVIPLRPAKVRRR